MSFATSIFDKKDQKFRLWHKKNKNFNEKLPTSFASLAFKPTKKSQELVQRHFYIKSHFLCYKRNPEDQKISGILDLNWTRAEFNKVEEEEDTGFKFVMMLIKQAKFTSIYFKDEQTMERWRAALRGVSAFTDFHQRFKVISLIGKGSYARVNKSIFYSFSFFSSKYYFYYQNLFQTEKPISPNKKI